VVTSNLIPWIMLASVIVTFFSVVVACVSAFYSRRSSQIAAKSAQAALYLRFQQEYATDKMLDDLNELRDWQQEYPLDFANRWGEQYFKKPKTDKACSLNKARRHVSHFFGAIADLYDRNYLSEPLARRLADLTGIDLMFDVVEPLEDQLGKQIGKPYDKVPFDTLHGLTKRTVERFHG
jgi:hypothetical protein